MLNSPQGRLRIDLKPPFGSVPLLICSSIGGVTKIEKPES